MSDFRSTVEALIVATLLVVVVPSASAAPVQAGPLHGMNGPDLGATSPAQTNATAADSVELTTRDEGRDLATVWNGGFTVKTGDGSLLLEWECARGEFHAVEFIGEGSTVTRGRTADSNGTTVPQVSHVGRLATSTSSTIRANAQWSITSDHDNRDPPGDCTAIIGAVEGSPELAPPRVDEAIGRTVLHEGELQVAAESRLQDGHAATYRIVSDGRERSSMAVAVGTLHLELEGNERPIQAAEDGRDVTTVVVRDGEVRERTEAPLDESSWHPAITAFAGPSIAAILRENPRLLTAGSGPDMVVSALTGARFNISWGDDDRVGVVTANDGTIRRVDHDGIPDSDYEIVMSRSTAEQIAESPEPLRTAVQAYRSGDITVTPGSDASGIDRVIAQVKLAVGKIVLDLTAG